MSDAEALHRLDASIARCVYQLLLPRALFTMSNFEPNAVIRGFQLTVVGSAFPKTAPAMSCPG